MNALMTIPYARKGYFFDATSNRCITRALGLIVVHRRGNRDHATSPTNTYSIMFDKKIRQFPLLGGS